MKDGVTRRRGVFGHADEKPYRRLTGDAVRLVLAAALVAVTAADPEFLRASERALDRFFGSLPGALDGVFRVVLAVGYAWGLALVVLAALVARRRRLALVLGLAGLAAWGVAKLLESLVDSGDSPTIRLAVLAAVVLAASPFLTRPIRRLGQVVLVFLVPGTVILGLGGVDDAVGAFAIGWGMAALLHLARMDLGKLTHYGALCAQALARAHARIGDAPALAGYLGRGRTFDRAVARFAADYAANNERDHAALVEAIAAGGVPSRTI